MDITVFQAGPGDCLLLRGSGGGHVLVDGGLSGSYEDHVAPALGQLRDDGVELDLVCVSHIDQDHIAGVLRLFDHEVEWRVYDYQKSQGNGRVRKPRHPRPPAVREVWHNAFKDQVDLNWGPLEDLLVLSMRSYVFAGETGGPLHEAAHHLSDLVTGERDALRLSHRLGDGQLGVPVNSPADGGLLVSDDVAPVSAGTLRLTLLGPTDDALERLRTDWQAWVRKNEKAIREIRDDARRDAERLHVDEAEAFRQGMAAVAGALQLPPGLRLGDEIGDRDKVTVPNLASITLLVEDGGRTALLTGDAHGTDLLDGLEASGALDEDGRIHVDLLKVPHHGSEHNADADFFERVTADHYVVCANGSHDNPDPRILRALVKARVQVGPDRPFKLWFNSSEGEAGTDSQKKHMRETEALVAQLEDRHGPLLSSRFLRRFSSFTVSL